jgi:hypothetical protein
MMIDTFAECNFQSIVILPSVILLSVAAPFGGLTLPFALIGANKGKDDESDAA